MISVSVLFGLTDFFTGFTVRECCKSHLFRLNVDSRHEISPFVIWSV